MSLTGQAAITAFKEALKTAFKNGGGHKILQILGANISEDLAEATFKNMGRHELEALFKKVGAEGVEEILRTAPKEAFDVLAKKAADAAARKALTDKLSGTWWKKGLIGAGALGTASNFDGPREVIATGLEAAGATVASPFTGGGALIGELSDRAKQRQNQGNGDTPAPGTERLGQTEFRDNAGNIIGVVQNGVTSLFGGNRQPTQFSPEGAVMFGGIVALLTGGVFMTGAAPANATSIIMSLVGIGGAAMLGGVFGGGAAKQAVQTLTPAQTPGAGATPPQGNAPTLQTSVAPPAPPAAPLPEDVKHVETGTAVAPPPAPRAAGSSAAPALPGG